MGAIRNLNTGEIIVLNTYHQFGRGVRNQTVINDSCISRSHATIRWDESEWQIIDYSKNGTVIDGKYIYHCTIKLKIGTKIQFGKKDSEVWEFIDDKHPRSYLKSLRNQNRYFELASLNIFPNDERPEVLFYKTNMANWEVDVEGEIIELKNGNKYVFGDEEWLFVENEFIESTTDFLSLVNQSYFSFSVSEDEEDVGVRIIVNDLQLDLGVRVYNHVLLKLVRKILEDDKEGVEYSRHGWVSMVEMTEYLSKELLHDIDEYYLNIQIYRLRKKIMELKPYGYLFSHVIERKRGELRFNHPYFEIIKGNNAIRQMHDFYEINNYS